MPVTATSHIRVDDNGVAWLEGTSAKVIEIVQNRAAYGWSPEELHLQLPQLSLAQIHSAMAYYYDNQDEIDAQIENDGREVDALMSQAAQQPTRRILNERLKHRQVNGRSHPGPAVDEHGS